MQHSESLINFAPAFVKAQAQLEDAHKTESGYQNRYKYADLGQVLQLIRPVFHDHGIAITQLGDGQEASIEVSEIFGKDSNQEIVLMSRPSISLETILMHESSEWISGKMVMPIEPMTANSFAQAFGSVVSYLRRYSLLAIAGITQVDDDGQQKSDSNPEGAVHGNDSRQSLNRSSTPEYESNYSSSPKTASDAQINALMKIGKNESTTEETKEILRKALADGKRLMSKEASALIDAHKTW